MVSEFAQQVLPSDFTAGPYGGKTLLWGYNGSYPGPTIEARRGVPTSVHFVNSLVNPALQQYLTVDQTIHWADVFGLMCEEKPGNPACFEPYQGPVPVVPHLHGGEDPSAVDGGPFAWFTPDLQQVGPAFSTDTYTYPNGQEATTLWYHDHVLGMTRLNVLAGLAGFYLLRDPQHEPQNLPKAPYEREIVIQDRQFDTSGQILFPDGNPPGLNGPPPNPAVHPFWNPEFFGDVIVVNGKAWPYLEVEPRRYRLRFLNGSNARFYTLSLVNQATGRPTVAFWQIGTDGGYLDHPRRVTQLTLAPGERADVIVDFTGVKQGTIFLMTNSANAPFPGGDPVDPKTTGQVMQLRVTLPLHGVDSSLIPDRFHNLRPLNPIVRLARSVTSTTPVRRLTLNEFEGDGGPLEVLLNNSDISAPATELPRVGVTEIWEFVNLTEDAHPLHPHLVQFQLLSRQPLDVDGYQAAYAAAFSGGVFTPETGPPLPYGDCSSAPYRCGGNPDVARFLIGPPMPPAPNERGWKDTIPANPGEVTRILIRWAPLDTPLHAVSPGVNRYPFDPTAGPGYVWHCHILDHEDNDMMRTYKVVP